MLYRKFVLLTNDQNILILFMLTFNKKVLKCFSLVLKVHLSIMFYSILRVFFISFIEYFSFPICTLVSLKTK